MVRAVVSIPEIDTGARQIGLVAHALLADGPGHATVLRARGIQDARTAVLLKAIPPASLSDNNFGSILADWAIAQNAFFSSLKTEGVFFAMLAAGIRKVPLQQRFGAVIAGAVAAIVGEGAPTPLSRLVMSGAVIQPIRAQSLVVLGREVVALMTAAATDLVNVELRTAVSRCVDAEFLALVSAGVAPLPPADSMAESLKAMLDSVNTAGGALYWAMAPDVANAASVLDPAHEMTPVGGTLLGLPALVSDAIPVGTLYLLNASGICGDAVALTLDTTQQAILEMEGAPDNPSAGNTVSVSLWQCDLVGLRCTVYFGAQKFLNNACAIMADVEWTSV